MPLVMKPHVFVSYPTNYLPTFVRFSLHLASRTRALVANLFSRLSASPFMHCAIRDTGAPLPPYRTLRAQSI